MKSFFARFIFIILLLSGIAYGVEYIDTDGDGVVDAIAPMTISADRITDDASSSGDASDDSDPSWWDSIRDAIAEAISDILSEGPNTTNPVLDEPEEICKCTLAAPAISLNLYTQTYAPNQPIKALVVQPNSAQTHNSEWTALAYNQDPYNQFVGGISASFAAFSGSKALTLAAATGTGLGLAEGLGVKVAEAFSNLAYGTSWATGIASDLVNAEYRITHKTVITQDWYGTIDYYLTPGGVVPVPHLEGLGPETQVSVHTTVSFRFSFANNTSEEFSDVMPGSIDPAEYINKAEFKATNDCSCPCSACANH